VTEQQWLETYKGTIRSLYGYMAKRTGGNRELTEDIVQETYLRALRVWKRSTFPDSPLAWLKLVSRNILVDFLRQKKWESKVDLDHLSETRNKASNGQIKSLEMFLAIASLGQKKAKIIEAFYYEGMSVKEVASEMALSERAVEGQLRRARHSLKFLLPELRSNGGKNE